MGVLEIIKANKEIFNVDESKNYTEKEAIRLIASMGCNGNQVQKRCFEIRQSYTAICNLYSLGFRESAVELSVELISKAEWFQQYSIAEDLCDKLVSHHFQYGSMHHVEKYKKLHDKFRLILSCEHDAMLLYGDAIYKHKHIITIEVRELIQKFEIIKDKLPADIYSLKYYYYYYQCKTLSYQGKELEELLVQAKEFFEGLYFKHTIYISIFTDKLIRFYLEHNELEKALLLVEKQTEKFESGTIRWFRNALSYVNVLLKMNNPKAIDVCDVVTANPKFKELPDDRKKEWEVAFKASIKIRTGSSKE